jgi:quercetin dioxygenase-like cupin family protein
MKLLKKVKPFFADERGEMFHLLDKKTPITSVLLITSRKGAIRANHYHKKDTHYSYLLSGSMEYTYRDLGGKNTKKKSVIIKKGEIVETPPMTEHAMRFLEDSVFLALTTEERDQKKYEKDTVRVKLV